MAPVFTEDGTITAEHLIAWEEAQDRICTMMRTRCERNPRAKINTKTNAKAAWDALAEYKPRGSGMLHSMFKKLNNVSLAGCENEPQTYASKFIEILNEFDNISEQLHFDENWLIWRFHDGLGSLYNSYYEQYQQNHDALKEDGIAKFTLDYAITRFINTVTNPSNSTTTEAIALAALVNGTFSHNVQSVTALAAGGATEHRIQPGAHAGNSRTFTQTCKHCKHCKMNFHDESECRELGRNNSNTNRGGHGGRGGRGSGRGGRGGRGGGNSKPKDDKDKPKDDNKPVTERQPPSADAAVATTQPRMAFSFVAHALIANSVSLQNRSHKPAVKAKSTMASTTSVSTAAALSCLYNVS